MVVGVLGRFPLRPLLTAVARVQELVVLKVVVLVLVKVALGHLDERSAATTQRRKKRSTLVARNRQRTAQTSRRFSSQSSSPMHAGRLRRRVYVAVPAVTSLRHLEQKTKRKMGADEPLALWRQR